MDLSSFQTRITTSVAGFAKGVDLAATRKAVLALLQDPSRDPRLAMLVISCIVLLLLLVAMIVFLLVTPSKKRVIVRRYVDDEADELDEAPKDAEEPALTEEESAPPPAPPRSSHRLFLALTGPIAMLVLGVVAFVALYVGTSTDVYCAHTCHAQSDRVVAATKASHASCVSCHEEPGIFAVFGNTSARLRMAYDSVMRVPSVAADDSVDSRSCLSCHWEVTRKVVTSPTGVRMSHKRVSSEPCTQCHKSTGHTKRKTIGSMQACIVCHDSKTASAECSTCHTHDPVTETFASGGESTSTIGTGRIQYPPVRAAKRDCTGCHDVARQCDGCHGVRMPHSADFMWNSGHARAAAFERKTRCFRCHDLSDCGRCHTAEFDVKTGLGGHPANWPADHKTSPWSGGCACHESRSSRKTSMCGLCHDLKTHALLPIEN